MATKIALGTTDMSGVYLGTTEIKKAYLGTNKVYEKTSEIYFDTLISPTTWTAITIRTKYTTTDTLGTWNITTENSINTSYVPSHALDNNSSTYWCGTAFSNLTTYTYFELECPVYIKPISIKIRQRCCGNATYPAYLQGYNENTSSWDNLATLTRTSTVYDDNFTLGGNTYYKKFRLYISAYGTSAGQKNPYVYLMNITEGYYKP